MGMVALEKVETPEEEAQLRSYLEGHVQHTGSTVAQNVLDNWSTTLPQFVKVRRRARLGPG